MLSILDILEDTTVDGPGFRTAIYAAGCPNGCPGCHNPESWDIKEWSRKNIWCYTGYTFEKLLRNPRQAQLLKYIDVLVDGKFKKELRDEELYFRGSRNQRLIDVQTSLQKGETVIYHYNPKKGI